MTTVQLTQGQVALVDGELFEAVNRVKWCAAWSPDTHSYYAVRTHRMQDGSRKTIRMHQFIAGLIGLELLPGETIDHHNRNSLDNRVANLRPATQAGQTCNQRKRCDNTSGFIGVSRGNGKWHAYATVNGKLVHLGFYDDPVEAARVRDAFVITHHGEFARLNFQDVQV